MRTVKVDARVADLCGLYLALKRALFDVHNVASDVRGTYVYLDDREDKDPSDLVLSWVGRPPIPVTSPASHENLKKQFETLPELVEAKGVEIEPPADLSPEKKSFIRSIFRRILP